MNSNVDNDHSDNSAAKYGRNSLSQNNFIIHQVSQLSYLLRGLPSGDHQSIRFSSSSGFLPFWTTITIFLCLRNPREEAIESCHSFLLLNKYSTRILHGVKIVKTESILPFLLTINKVTTVDGQQFKEYDARKYTLLAPPQCQHIAYCKC